MDNFEIGLGAPQDVHRPVSPKMGGSFLDLPLAGKGAGSGGDWLNSMSDYANPRYQKCWNC